MKANELRIGNWVMVFPVKNPQQVCDVMFDSVNTESVFGQHYGEVDPIPLTEDWLLKFGFNRRQIKDLISYNTNQLELYQYASNNNKIFFEYADGEVQLKYVHQLQNLHFALTGMELKCAVRKLNK